MNRRGMMSGLAAGIVAVGVVLGLAQQASAATLKITYTGAVAPAFNQTQVIDQTGVFGTAGADLAGKDYNLVFKVDTTIGNYSTFSGTPSGDQVFGGISADLTITGHTYAYTGVGSPGGNFDIASTKPGLGSLTQQFSLNGVPSEVHVALTYTNPPSGFPTSILTPFTLTSCPAASCTFNGFFYAPAKTVPNSGPLFGMLAFGSVSATVTPIPATLPLMVSALGGLGFAAWRRKRVASAQSVS